MAGQSVVRFVLDGTGKAVQSIDNVKKKLLGLNQANATPSGNAAARQEREGRTRFGKLAKAGQLASGIGPLGQLAEVAGAATPGLAALGIAAVAGGFAIAQFGKMLSVGVQAIKDDVNIRYGARATIKSATDAANQTALGSALGQRDKIMGGNQKGITPETLKFFATMDKLSADIDKANLQRALSTGEGIMRSELARTKSPESAAMLDMTKAAQESVDIQREIKNSLGFFQKTWVLLSNSAQGKGRNYDLYQAENNRNSLMQPAP